MLGPITVQIRQEGVGTDLLSTDVFYQLMPVISLFLFIKEEYITGLPKQQWVRGIQIRKGKKCLSRQLEQSEDVVKSCKNEY